MTKSCSKCKAIKDVSEFHFNKCTPDGLYYWCKQCRKQTQYDLSHQKIWRHANSEKLRQQSRLSYQRNKDKILKRSAIRRQAHRKEAAAHKKVYNAIRRGIIKKLPCKICGTTTSLRAHHPNYDFPLDVIWLCSIHHAEEHVKTGVKYGRLPIGLGKA